jgi:hypothetical protein
MRTILAGQPPCAQVAALRATIYGSDGRHSDRLLPEPANGSVATLLTVRDRDCPQWLIRSGT